ncbi:cation diffusion facilitator family transporter [Oricola thermophila]|uniref:Protein p34 n=1 Tax=Oricola thermophila TaxID=2742145 RepID=A0A6N1V984_9HYPH|nr:cation diffusion facilitator family transporter [Oricola thermophila]QKV17073.1 cation transporter [Oricola thermophila]
MAGTAQPIVKRLATGSIAVAFGVMALKLAAWHVTGSVALLSDALESTVNVIAALIAYFAVSYAQKPADAEHPFGHSKAEYFSAVIEGVLIVVAALLIAHEAFAALFAPVLPEAPALGLGINMVAAAINGMWAFLLIRAGREHRSPALVADGRHLFTDVVTSLGVFAGLLAALATGYAILDPLLAIGVACNILWEGWKVIASSVDGLMDRAAAPADESAIRAAIAGNAGGSVDVHDLKTRQAGRMTFVDFHMVVPAEMTVAASHDICDRMEEAIRAAIPGARVTIHVEPEGVRAHGARVTID